MMNTTAIRCALALAAMFFYCRSIDAQGTTSILVSTGQNIDAGEVTFIFPPVLNDSGNIAFKGQVDVGGQLFEVILQRVGNSFVEIAKESDVAPGGGVISNFSNVLQLNHTNAVSLVANLLNNDSALLLFRQGNLNELIREGDLVPFGGTFGALPGPFQPPLLTNNNTDSVIVAPQLLNTGADRGIFRASVGNVFTVARENDPVPNGGSFIDPSRATVGHLNDVGFASQVSGGANGIFLFNGNIPVTISDQGQSSPDGNGTFATYSLNGEFGVSLPNANDEMAFLATLNGTSAGNSDDSGLFYGDRFGLNAVVRESDLLPGSSTDKFQSFFTPILNDASQVAFAATFEESGGETSSGIFRYENGTLMDLVKTNQVAPDGNGKFGLFNTNDSKKPEMNNSGVVLFQTSLESTPDDYGIFLTDGIDTVTVAQKGQSLAGSEIVSLSATTSNTGANGSSFNESNQVAYRANLADGRWIVARFAPDIHWRTNGDGNWFNDQNWRFAMNPTDINNVIISPDSNATVSGPGPDLTTTIRSLQIGGGSGNATLHWPVGFELNAGNEITLLNGASLTGGGLISTETIFAEPDSEIVSTGQMFVQTESIENEGNIVVNGMFTLDGDLRNSGEINVAANLGTAMNIFGCLDQNSIINIGINSEAVVSCLQGSGSGSGLGTITVLDLFRPGGGQDVANLGYVTMNLNLGSECETVVQLGGTDLGEFDRISVRQANVEGDLDVELFNGFELERGMQFSILATSLGVDGQFDLLPQGAIVDSFDGLDLRIDYEAGISNNSVSLFVPFEIGDVNQDDLINLLDVQPFVQNVSLGNYQFEADINQDGNVNLLDVQPFVNLLSGG